MYKKIGFLVVGLLTGINVSLSAQEGQPFSSGWQVELSRLSLDITSNEVRSAKEYKDFPDARLNSDSETSFTGNLHALADYYAPKWLWSNSLALDYGRTRIRPVVGNTLTNENADQILFTTGYTQRLWQVENWLGGFEAGPFGSVGYETEFTDETDSPRRKIYRGMLGIKIFDGKYLKDFYVSAVGEADHTYSPSSQKLAWEVGTKLKTTLREGVEASLSAWFRDYVHESHRYPTDVDYELEAEARLDVKLYDNLSIAPFISFYTAQGKYVAPRGTNVYVGVSLSFSHIFINAKEKTLKTEEIPTIKW